LLQRSHIPRLSCVFQGTILTHNLLHCKLGPRNIFFCVAKGLAAIPQKTVIYRKLLLYIFLHYPHAGYIIYDPELLYTNLVLTWRTVNSLNSDYLFSDLMRISHTPFQSSTHNAFPTWLAKEPDPPSPHHAHSSSSHQNGA
jgi:hypothetical protein